MRERPDSGTNYDFHQQVEVVEQELRAELVMGEIGETLIEELSRLERG